MKQNSSWITVKNIGGPFTANSAEPKCSLPSGTQEDAKMVVYDTNKKQLGQVDVVKVGNKTFCQPRDLMLALQPWKK